MAEYLEDPYQCHLNVTFNYLIYLLVINVTLIFVPTVCLAFLYTYIIVKLRKHSKLFTDKFISPSSTSNVDGLRLNFKQPICYYFDKNSKQLVRHYPEEQSQMKNNSTNSQHHSDESSTGSVAKCKRASCPANPTIRVTNGQHTASRVSRNNTFNTVTLNGGNHNRNGNKKYSPNHHCAFKKNRTSKSCVLCFSTLTNKIECKCKITKAGLPFCCLNRRDSSNIGSGIQSINGGFGDVGSLSQASHRLTNGDLSRLSSPADLMSHSKSITNKYQIVGQERRPTQYSLRRELTRSKLKFTIVISMVTLAFFCCQLPVRIFISWSYLTQYFMIQPEHEEQPVKENLLFIDICLNTTKLIYFFHAISNPIIYNILSRKIRKVILSLTTFKKTRLFQFSFKMPNRVVN